VTWRYGATLWAPSPPLLGRRRDSDFGSAVPEMVESPEGAHPCSRDGAWCSCVGGRSRGRNTSQLFLWRRQLYGAQRFGSLEVPTVAARITAMKSGAPRGLPTSPGVIEIEFKTGVRLRICGRVDTPIVSAVMQALIGPEEDQTAEHNDQRER
jgi:hypothetical protein